MIYRLSSDNENYRNYRLPKDLTPSESIKISDSFDGRSHKDTYQTIYLEMTLKSEDKYPVADLQLGVVPICSERFKSVVEEMCGDEEVEFLPCNLENTDGNYYIFNILGQEDCINYEKSKFTRFPSTGRIMMFEHVEIKNDVNKHFFRINDFSNAFYFISEYAKENLEKANLIGLEFDNKLFE